MTTHKWVLMVWVAFILFAAAYLAYTPYGALNIWFSRHYDETTGQFFKYYTHLGEEWFLVPIGVALLIWIRKLDFFIRLTFTFLINTLLTVILKFFVFDHARPSVVLEQFNLVFTEGVVVHQYNGFPSGHSSAAFAMAMGLALWFEDGRVSLLAVFLAMGVGISRIYLHQHFLEDVLAGAVTGLIAAFIASGFTWKPKLL